MFLFTSGCVRTASFRYDYPQGSKPAVAGLKIAYTYPKDERQPNEDVDKMWSKDPIEDIGKIIQEEIQSTGLFGEVVPIAKGEEEKLVLEKSGIRMVLHASIKELSWEIPNLKEQETKAFVISILTGGIGGLIYGSGSTDFYGKAKLRVVLDNRETGRNLLDKEYSSRAEERMARLKTDSANERARIIGRAVKQVMEQFKADLDRALKGR